MDVHQPSYFRERSLQHTSSQNFAPRSYEYQHQYRTLGDAKGDVGEYRDTNSMSTDSRRPEPVDKHIHIDVKKAAGRTNPSASIGSGWMSNKQETKSADFNKSLNDDQKQMAVRESQQHRQTHTDRAFTTSTTASVPMSGRPASSGNLRLHTATTTTQRNSNPRSNQRQIKSKYIDQHILFDYNGNPITDKESRSTFTAAALQQNYDDSNAYLQEYTGQVQSSPGPFEPFVSSTASSPTIAQPEPNYDSPIQFQDSQHSFSVAPNIASAFNSDNNNNNMYINSGIMPTEQWYLAGQELSKGVGGGVEKGVIDSGILQSEQKSQNSGTEISDVIRKLLEQKQKTMLALRDLRNGNRRF